MGFTEPHACDRVGTAPTSQTIRLVVETPTAGPLGPREPAQRVTQEMSLPVECSREQTTADPAGWVTPPLGLKLI